VFTLRTRLELWFSRIVENEAALKRQLQEQQSPYVNAVTNSQTKRRQTPRKALLSPTRFINHTTLHGGDIMCQLMNEPFDQPPTTWTALGSKT